MDLSALVDWWLSLTAPEQVLLSWVVGAIPTALLALGPEVQKMRPGRDGSKEIDPACGLLVTLIKAVTWPLILVISFLKSVTTPW